MSLFVHDVRFAVRSLLRNPTYTLAALLTLLIGIGANVAVFSVVRGVLLAPLPFPDPDRLVSIREENGSGHRMSAAWTNFVDWRSRQHTLESVGAYNSGGETTVLGLDRPIRVAMVGVSDGFFRTLGVQPARGRVMVAEEHRLGGAPAVVVSDRFWRTHLGSDPAFAERILEVGGFHARVIGVMPPGFDFPGGIDIWGAVELNDQSESRTAHNYNVVGRLAAGSAIAGADDDFDAITAAFLENEPGVAEEDWFEDFYPRAAHVEPLVDAIVGETRRPLWVMLGASALVLLVACSNLASAMLARGTARVREYALRRSLGAGRAQIIRHVMTESLVLAGAGSVLGIGAAAAAIHYLPALAPSGIPRIDQVRLDGTVLLAGLALALVTALLFGLMPAMRVSEGRFASPLRTGDRGGPGRSRHRVWNGLIAIEVALALTLLIGSGLLLRSFWTVLRVEPGFRTQGLLTATLNPPTSRYTDGDSRAAFLTRVMREIGILPAVEAAGLITAAPMTGVSNGLMAVRESPVPGITADYQLASSGFFGAMGIPLLRGRLFDDVGDGNPEAPHVVVVNSAFADAAWPGEDPIGKQMTGGGMDDYWDKDRWATVIGVVGDMRQRDLTLDPRPTAYFPYAQRPFRSWSMTLVARAGRGTAAGLTPSIRDAVGRIDPDVPVTFATIESRISGSLTPRRFTMSVLAFFAAAALLLACVGIWGVVAYAVARRTREIGIRMALGADARSVRRLVQRGYLRAAAAGALIGLLLSAGLTRVLRSLLYEVQPTDPATLAGVLIAMASATWLASFVPARRSTRVSPLETMRAE